MSTERRAQLFLDPVKLWHTVWRGDMNGNESMHGVTVVTPEIGKKPVSAQLSRPGRRHPQLRHALATHSQDRKRC